MIATDPLDRVLQEAAARHAEPLWTQIDVMVPPQPVARAVPYVWMWDDLRPLLGRAGDLIGTNDAERRVFMLVNPAMRAPHTTDTLYAGLQLIKPGEIARAHRHVAFALRFIIEGDAAYTAVEGEKVTMTRGDLVLTPSWNWHDHGHDGDAPMVWLDGLDLPVYQFFPGNFAEPYADERYPSEPGPAESPLRFPWQPVQAALDAQPGGFARYEYHRRNRERHISRVVGASAERIAGGASAPLRRETAGLVYHVYAGSGRTRVADTMLEWKQGDTFCIPAWNAYRHEAAEDTYLFRFDDRPILEAIGAYRVEDERYDLRVHPPRSPREQLAGLMFLPRTIDKVCAKLQGTLGLYQVRPGISTYLFEWLGITEEQFTDSVRHAAGDRDVAEWLLAHADASLFPSINERLSARGIRDEQHFEEVLPRYPMLRERPELRNWFEIFELDDAWTFDPAHPERRTTRPPAA